MAIPQEPYRSSRRVEKSVVVALVCVVLGGVWVVGQRQRVVANVWNIGNIMTMLRNYRAEHGRYPPRLALLEPYNVTENVFNMRRRAQDLKVNEWHERFIYSSSGTSYTLISPGRHGYATGKVIPWPEYDGPHQPDTSLVIVDGVAKYLTMPPSQERP